jgi:hypothetical protein
MLLLFTDLADTMAELRRYGVSASAAWHADMDGDALVLVEPDAFAAFSCRGATTQGAGLGDAGARQDNKKAAPLKRRRLGL